MTWVTPGWSGPRAPIADYVLCQFCFLPSACICLTGLSFTPFCLWVACCWLHPLFSGASVLEGDLCFFRTSVLVVTKCVCLHVCVLPQRQRHK